MAFYPGLLGKYIHQTSQALSGFILTVNSIIGGALVLLTVLVNGILLAIAASIEYLGNIILDKECQRMGGPGGLMTKEITQMLELLGRAAGF